MAEINDLNITDASNTSRFPESMAPSAINNGARALEGMVARWHENINTSISTTGSGNAYVLDAKGTQTLFDGLVIGFDANHANTGASTLNVDSTGVKNILKHNDVALASGDIEANQKVIVIYDGTSWQMISQLGNAPGRAKGADIASASPLVIGDGDYFDVTGTTGFAAMTVAANRHFFLQFDGALVMTHHATNLDLPGAANITTAAGDVAEFFSTGSNTVQCVNYTKADGTPVVGAGGLEFVSRTVNAKGNSVASMTVNFDETAYNNWYLAIEGFRTLTSGNMRIRWSEDNGTTYSGNSYGFMQGGGRGGATFDTGQNAVSYGLLTPTQWNDDGVKFTASLDFNVKSGTDNNQVGFWWTGTTTQTASNYQSFVTGALRVVYNDGNTAFEVSNSGGNIDEGILTLYGRKES